MRSLLLFILSGFFTATAFSQSSQTVTLVFVSAPNDNVKNYEAVIDDVSYYSENNPPYNKSQGSTNNNRNTIWLNNFMAGQHSIQVYNIKSGEERSSNTPVYSSTFTVREGFDTRIAIRNNGQVQFSERQSALNSGNTNQATDNNDNNNNEVYNRTQNNTDSSYNGRANRSGRMNRRRNNNTTNDDADNGTVSNDGTDDGTYNNGNTQNGRIKRSRNNGDTNTDDANRTTSDNSDGTYNNDGSSNERTNRNRKVAMNDNDFSQLIDNIRKQWLPGTKLPLIRDEFVTSGHYFTTAQVVQLITLLTDENNRLQLAKASYHTITDPENFGQMDDLFTIQSNKNALDKYVRDYQY